MGKEGKPGRRAKALRPMYRGYVCFSPRALHRHWYKQHPFLRGPTPEASRSSTSEPDLIQLARAPSPYMLTNGVTALAEPGQRSLQCGCHGLVMSYLLH